MTATKRRTDKKELFEKVPVEKALLIMAVPTVISQLINLVYNMVDTIYIGRTGNPDMTAAVTLAFTVFMMTIAFSNLFGVGASSLMARLAGSGDRKTARAVSAAGFYGAVVVSVIYSLLVGIFADPLLRLLGASENTIGYAKQYTMIVVVAGCLPTVLSAVAAHLIRGSGYSRQASIGLSMGGILNIFLDPLFMFVLLPKGYEIVGAAIATLVSNVVSCIYLTVTLAVLSKKTVLSADPREIRGMNRDAWNGLFSVGVPSAMLTGLFDLANIVLNYLMAAHGDPELAAVGIVMKAERLPNAINIGICQGMLPIVAYNFASGDHKRMNRTVNTARLWGVIVSVATLLLYELFSPSVCRLFLDVGENNMSAAKTIMLATVFLRIRCISSLPQFFNYSTSYCMQAVGYGSGTLLHACVRELVFYIPFMILFNRLFGMYGLTAAIIAGESCGALFALLIFGRWKKKHVNLI